MNKWFILKFVGLGLIMASLIDIVYYGTSYPNVTLCIVGFCFVFSGMIQDIRKKK